MQAWWRVISRTEAVPPQDPVALSQALIRIDSVNPPGSEEACAALIRPMLEASGFSVAEHRFGPERVSLVAHRPGRDAALAPLAFTGHFDTVPLGTSSWARAPLSGDVADGMLHGRGAADMKAGVAAFVVAAMSASTSLARGLLLVLTAGEEMGCEGARYLASTATLPSVSGLVIAEPTANRLALAHKGALHLRARTTGRAAHASMPQLGDNALIRAIAAVGVAAGFDLAAPPDTLLGASTLAVTTMHSGQNVNSIPDRCEFTIDIRTVPGQDHAALLARLAGALAPATLDAPMTDVPAIRTTESDPFARCVAAVVAARFGNEAAALRGMSYFTDGSILKTVLGNCPSVIFGPGEPGQPHQTDEHCSVAAIEAACEAYSEIIRAWCA